VEDLVREARSLVQAGMHDAEAAAKVLAPVDLHELVVVDYEGTARLLQVGLSIELNRISAQSRVGGETPTVKYHLEPTLEGIDESKVFYRLLDGEYDIPRGKVLVRDMHPDEGLELAANLRRKGLGMVIVAKRLRYFGLKAKAAGLDRIGDLFDEAEGAA
jgi:hypothetical protein